MKSIFNGNGGKFRATNRSGYINPKYSSLISDDEDIENLELVADDDKILNKAPEKAEKLLNDEPAIGPKAHKKLIIKDTNEISPNLDAINSNTDSPNILDLRKIPVTPDAPPPPKTCFSAVGVATATPPSDKIAFESADGAPGGNEVLRKSSKPTENIALLTDQKSSKIGFFRKIKISLKPSKKAILPITGLLLLVALSGAIFALKPQKTVFSYADNNCYKGMFLLPNSQKITGDGAYSVVFENQNKLFGKQVIAREYCLKPLGAPKQDSSSKVTASLMGLKVFSKNITIATPKYPSFNKDLTSLRAIPIAEPIQFKLSSPDTIFGFALTANSKTVDCKKDQNLDIKCDPTPLDLKHATEYTFAIERTFNEKPVQTVSSEKIVTIAPIVITNSSIANNSVRYEKPKTITLTLDKPVQSVSEATLIYTKDSKKIPIKTKFENSIVTIEISEELARGQGYKLTIDNIHASDGGSLTSPYELSFSTSNGPKVTGVSIGNNAETLDQNIVIKFDQNLDAAQDVAKNITISSSGKTISAKSSVSGSSITLRANENLPDCTAFTIAVDANINSAYGITGASAWSYSSRTECFTTFSIGKSVGGRAIMAYRYGSGGNAVLYVAGVHGNEQNATKLLYKWINEINTNPQKVPAGRTIVIIPSVNPDGYVKNQRVNASGIDLNRNFAANNWKSTIKEPSGVVLPQGGGASAQSEPETAALSSYVSSLRPLMVMSYHSYGGLAIANDAGASRSLASAYGAKGGYVYKNGDTIGNTFNYDTTGAFEDWLYDKLGTPAILVELRTQYNDEFSSNVGPMWTIAQTNSF